MSAAKGLLGRILDPGFRQAASLVIRVGREKRDIGMLAELVSELEITAPRAEAATGRLTFEDRRRETGQFMAADAGLFARWEHIEIHADFQTHEEEIFRGYITELAPEIPESGGEAKLVLTLQDESAALNRTHMRRMWGQQAAMSDLAILRELVKPFGISVVPGSHEGQSSRALAMDATPIQFLRERARANGYELIFAQGTVYFGEMRLKADAQPTVMVLAGDATNCTGFALADDAQKPDAVSFEIAAETPDAPAISAIVRPNLPLLGKIPAAREGAGLGAESLWKLSRDGDEPEAATRARAQAAANEASFKIRATGQLDGTAYGHVLRAGLPVEIDGTGARNGGLYYVDTVTHRITQEGYTQSFELIRNATGEAPLPAPPPLDRVFSAISGLF